MTTTISSHDPNPALPSFTPTSSNPQVRQFIKFWLQHLDDKLQPDQATQSARKFVGLGQQAFEMHGEAWAKLYPDQGRFIHREVVKIRNEMYPQGDGSASESESGSGNEGKKESKKRSVSEIIIELDPTWRMISRYEANDPSIANGSRFLDWKIDEYKKEIEK